MRYESKVEVGRRKLTLLRPMLGVRRSEIDQFLEATAIPYRDDASNADPFTPRNRLRAEILPLLGEVMARDVVPAIVRASESSLESEEALDELLQTLDLMDPQGRLFLPKVRKLAEPLQRRALFVYLKDAGVPNLSRDVVERCLGLLSPDTPAKVSLPGALHCCRRANRIFVE
jgi:tRNA(Ile)-lysidine synthase